MTDDVIDFEEGEEGEAPKAITWAPPDEVDENAPLSLVVNDLHITYRVFGGKKLGTQNIKKESYLHRLLDQSRNYVSAVNEVKAVRGVSFVAHRGESIGIVGINGSGKSTLLRAITGLIPPTKGSVYVGGEPALLGVNAVLMGDLTGERNIMVGGLGLGMTKDEVAEKFDDIVDFAGIGDFVYLPMKAYSSGMAARLRFAISSSAVPDILMVDEALATGDAAFRNKSQERIEEIRKQAGTVFLVSHSLGSVRSICSRVLWMHEGLIVMDGPVDEVCDAYKEYTDSLKDLD